MRNLRIKGTEDLPSVEFSETGKLFMGGASLPENPKEFFDPIMDWIEEYKNKVSTSTQIEFSFNYLNTASTYMMARIVGSLRDIKKSLSKVNVTWYYEPGDLDMKELGSELLEFSDVEFSIVEIDA